ncbi:hypothetical protein OBBRIDRAFT_515446 [Obba rivulosa]|uniref:Uncharacterized protein n=1 Tax=Obba rivulosa TaxID=1052685 RepID=A0A8E2AVZ0_9APHY|nr:hypothetical protein OBBRIDRAFT_515446 [Obba rivulosa]
MSLRSMTGFRWWYLAQHRVPCITASWTASHNTILSASTNRPTLMTLLDLTLCHGRCETPACTWEVQKQSGPWKYCLQSDPFRHYLY